LRAYPSDDVAPIAIKVLQKALREFETGKMKET
jgi:hypothetical protein